MIKAILFDLDNVLVDAAEWHYKALNKALQEVANYQISREDHISIYNGLPTKKKLELLIKEGKIKESNTLSIWNKKQEYTEDIIKNNAKTDWDKVRMHQRLQEMGFKIGCVTNSIRKTAELMLNSTGQLEYMNTLVTNEDIKLNKPNPHPYWFAFANLNISRQECVIIEDSPHGIKSAEDSGAYVIRVSGPNEVNLKLLEPYIINDNKTTIDLFKNLCI